MPRRTETEIEGVTRRDFENWLHNPVTKMYLRFLTDYRAGLITQIVGQWESGALKLSDEMEARGRAVAIKEMIELQFSHITGFYLTDNLGTNDGSEEDRSS